MLEPFQFALDALKGVRRVLRPGFSALDPRLGHFNLAHRVLLGLGRLLLSVGDRPFSFFERPPSGVITLIDLLQCNNRLVLGVWARVQHGGFSLLPGVSLGFGLEPEEHPGDEQPGRDRADQRSDEQQRPEGQQQLLILRDEVTPARGVADEGEAVQGPVQDPPTQQQAAQDRPDPSQLPLHRR